MVAVYVWVVFQPIFKGDSDDFKKILNLGVKKMRANADTPDGAILAAQYGAE